MAGDKVGIDTFKPPFKEEEGRTIPRPQVMRRKDMPQTSDGTGHGADSAQSGLEGDGNSPRVKQDTPGRPKSASSRQQTQPAQATQSGSANLDAAASKKR